MIVQSFGFKSGVPAADVVIDCRKMRNPHSVAALRGLDGRHAAVQDYVAADPEYAALLLRGVSAASAGQDVAFGCHGGRHRSVAMAERLAVTLAAVGVCATIKHRCL